MAIAYFIPDQIKLLARGAAQQQPTHQNTANSTPLDNQHQTNTNANTTPPTTAQQQQQRRSTTTTPPHNIRTNITIPLPAPSSAASSHTVGCWELLTQAFCYALRIHHASRLNASVIQISFEFSGGISATAATTPAPPPPTSTQPQATTTETNTDNTTTSTSTESETIASTPRE